MRLVIVAVASLCVTGLAPSSLKAEDTDSTKALQVDSICKANPGNVRVENDNTSDKCRGGQIITIDGRDGKITLKPGETRYFAIPQKDDYNRDGGWYWWCSGSKEEASLTGAKYIKAERNSDGEVTWRKISVDPI